MCVRADAHLVDVSWRRNFFCSRVRLFLAVSSTQRSSGFSFLLSRRLYASMRAPTLFQRCRCFRPSWWKGKKKGCEKRDANLRYPSTCACFEGNLMPICSSDRWASRRRIHHEFESFHRKRSHFGGHVSSVPLAVRSKRRASLASQLKVPNLTPRSRKRR